ncbi:MAG: diguanylate cyclase [Spirochaetales bacterium]|nr:diguanylate cyclase [Spirochaetales bacterium]
MHKRYCFSAVLFIFSLASLYSQSPVILQKGTGKYPLGKELQYIEDQEGLLSLEQVMGEENRKLYQNSQAANLNFGFTRSVIWIRFLVQNPFNDSKELILEYAHPHMDLATLYIIPEEGTKEVYQGGDLFPYSHRQLDYKNLIFDLTVPPMSSTEVYMKFQTKGSMQIPLTLWTTDAFIERVNKEQFLFGLYFGIMIALLFYNLFLFITLQDRNYLFYILYMFFFILVQLEISRYDMEYLWPDATGFANISFPMFYNLAFFSAALFTRSFLSTRVNTPVLDKVILFLMGVGCIGFCLTVFVSYNAGFFPVLYILAIFEPPILLIAGISCLRKGYKKARLFIIAWTVLIISSFIFNLRNLTVLPSVFFTDYALYFGSALEALFLSFALANRTIELERSNRRLEQISHIDGLTGLFNRRFFDRKLTEEWKRQARTGHTLSLILCDIDHFKLFNDTYGHPAGDECLKKIAAVLNSNHLRDQDSTARYGGEEFAIILPDTDRKGALMVAEKLLDDIRQLKIPHSSSSVCDWVTMSMGVASTVPLNENKPSDLLSASDKALYKSKENGRNRVTEAFEFL